jgi:hypothetical protein
MRNCAHKGPRNYNLSEHAQSHADEEGGGKTHHCEIAKCIAEPIKNSTGNKYGYV